MFKIIKFLEDTEVEVIESISEEGEIENSDFETFIKNEMVEVDILRETDGIAEMQFGDGSVCCLGRSEYDIVD